MEDQEVRLRELQEELSNQRSLLENVGWRELMQTAQEQLKLRLPTVLSKTDNLLETLGKEFEKGEIAGIELFCSLPGVRMVSLEEDIDKLEKELGYDDGERTTDDTDSGAGAFEPAVPSVG